MSAVFEHQGFEWPHLNEFFCQTSFHNPVLDPILGDVNDGLAS